MTITRAQAQVLLEPKLSAIQNDALNRRPVEWTAFLNQRSTKKATVTDYNMTMFGGFVLKPEGQNITYDDWIPGNQKTYQPVRKALGYKITDEMIAHELYGQVDRLERGLMDSALDDQETTAALLFNNGFVTTAADGFSATGFDGLALFSTAHTRLDGGSTQRNRPSTDVDLGVTGLQSALIDIRNWVNHRGRPVLARAQKLYVNPEDMFTAKELLQSEYKPGTAQNEINALKSEGLTFTVLSYLTDNDAWFVQCAEHDCNWIWETQPRGGMDEDFDNEIIKRKLVYGAVAGHGEWYGTWGTTGA
jgi:hypothetical protein